MFSCSCLNIDPQKFIKDYLWPPTKSDSIGIVAFLLVALYESSGIRMFLVVVLNYYFLNKILFSWSLIYCCGGCRYGFISSPAVLNVPQCLTSLSNLALSVCTAHVHCYDLLFIKNLQMLKLMENSKVNIFHSSSYKFYEILESLYEKPPHDYVPTKGVHS